MALTRAQLLMGDAGQGTVLAGEPQGVRSGGNGITIRTDGVIEINSQTIIGVMKMGQTPAAAAAAYNGYTWPTTAGVAGQQLETNGSGVLSWADADGIDWTTKGQLIVGTGAGSDILLNSGISTSMLIADPSSASGLSYTDSLNTAMLAVSGTGAQRPSLPVAGQFRFNEDTEKFEFYTGTAWEEIASGNPIPGGNTFVKQSIPLNPAAQTGNALIPTGTTLERQTVPAPVDGSFRYNTDLDQLEVWTGAGWAQMPSSTGFDFVLQTRPAAGKTASAVIPRGTSAEAEAGAVGGWLRYNTDFNELQIFNGTDWDLIAPSQGAVSSFVQAATPTARNVGDIWYDTVLQRESVWDGGSWAQPGVTQTGPSGAALIPSGIQGDRPSPLVTGQFRLNTTTGKLEVYTGTGWEQVASGNPLPGGKTYVEQTIPITGTASAVIPPGPAGSEQSNPAPLGGYLRYNTTQNFLEFFNGTVWELIAPSAGGVHSFVQSATPTAFNSGDIWYDTTLQRESVWDGLSWVQPGVSQTGPLGAAILPSGTSPGDRPGGVAGRFRYSTTTGFLEFYNGTRWVEIAGGIPDLGLNFEPSNNLLKGKMPVVAAPPTPGTGVGQAIDGSVYWDSQLGSLFVRYNDGNTTQWVPAIGGTTTTGTLDFPNPAAQTPVNVYSPTSTPAATPNGASYTYNTAKGVWTQAVGGAAPWSGLYTGPQAAGGSSIEFYGIPAWAERVTFLGYNISTNGTVIPVIQPGAGFFATAGYSGLTYGQSQGQLAFETVGWTTGVSLTNNMVSTMVYDPCIVFVKANANNWVISGSYGRRGDGLSFHGAGGVVSLPGALDRIRIFIGGGQVFDSGTFNVLYEGPA